MGHLRKGKLTLLGINVVVVTDIIVVTVRISDFQLPSWKCQRNTESCHNLRNS